MLTTCGCGCAEIRVAGMVLSATYNPRLIPFQQRPPSVTSDVRNRLGVMGRERADRRRVRGYAHWPYEPAATGMASSPVPRIAELAAGLVAAAGD